MFKIKTPKRKGFQDDFNRSNYITLGADWLNFADDDASFIAINSNMAYGSNDGVDKFSLYNQNLGDAQFSEATITTSSDYCGVIVRGSGSNYITFKGYILWLSDPFLVLSRLDNGVYFTLDAVNSPCVEGDVITIKAYRRTIVASKNGIVLMGGQSYHYSSGKAGINVYGGNVSLDNWIGGEL